MNLFAPGKHGFESYPSALPLEVDVCVIGAGAGGCATAAALAQSGLTVAVLEEGRHWEPGQFKPTTAAAFKNLYQDRGLRSLRGNAIIPMPGGRGVGGSTLINSAICFRTPPAVLQCWRDEHGCDSFTEDRFAPYFDRIWRTLGVTVNPVAVQRNNNLIFKEGAEKLGLRGEFTARSAPGCVGCGICQYGCPSGGKSSADRTFLAEALQSGRVGVYADCRMTGVETQGDRVVAVSGELVDPDTHEGRGSVRVKADTFVLSAGPIGSPVFLLKHGLADDAHCGQHLVVHPTSGVMARFEQEIRPWSGVTQGYYVDCWDRGFLLQTFTVTPDQYYLVMQSRAGAETLGYMRDLAHMASAGALVHDQDSAGAVRHTVMGPDLSYFFGEGDKRRLIDGIRLAAEVFFAAGAREVFAGHMNAKAIPSPGQIAASIPYDIPAHHLFLYASHPMGTCRMGADPAASVVDPQGRVWGWANLRVADASMFPTSLGVNPQVTTMAMGLMVGESIALGEQKQAQSAPSVVGLNP
jgi:choline dehydrogenase-like flavoprotein